MIADWRSKWHQGTNGQTDPQFPFGFVQLNSIGNGSVYNNPMERSDDPFSNKFGYAGLRWSQTAGYGFVPNPAQPNVFMATSFDTPDRPQPFRSPLNGVFDQGFNVHSPFKQPTAARLARAGLKAAYGMEVDTVTPLFDSVQRRGGNVVVVTLKDVGSGVELHGTKGFEVLSAGRWRSVQVSGHTKSTVTITGVPSSGTKLRYSWYSNPCGEECFGCAVYVAVVPIGSMSGEEAFLPLPPFVTDL